MLSVPAARVEVERLAALPVSGTMASVAPLDLNVTVPVAPEVTVAVNVTVCPTIEGFTLETTDMVLGYLLTTCFSAGEVLLALFASPTYLAIMEWFPDMLN